MAFYVHLLNRSHAEIRAIGNLKFEPISYRWTAQGGPQSALIEATGDPGDLFKALSWLRFGVEIVDERARPRWWGYVHDTLYAHDNVAEGFSLLNMANKVAVVWANDTQGGITAWAENADSQEAFGVKELIDSVNNVTETAAERKRDAALEARKFPVIEQALGLGDEHHTSLDCRGWAHSLGWTYYDRDEGQEQHIPSGAVAQKLGWGLISTDIAFTSGTRRVSEDNAKLNNLNKGEKFRAAITSNNNGVLTVETGSTRERATYTGADLAFLQQERTVNNEYIRGSVSVSDHPRQLNNPNVVVYTGTHTGSSGSASLVDSAQPWDDDELIDLIAQNLTDGSSATITDNTSDTVTGALSGGTDNDWDNGDSYRITTIVVQDETDTTTYTEGTDYTIDYANGTITCPNATTTIVNNQVLHVDYIYVENRIESTDLGLKPFAANLVMQVAGSGSNDGFYRILQGSTEGDRVVVKESLIDEQPGANVTLSTGSTITVEESLTDELPDGATGETLTGYGEQVEQSFQISSDNTWTVNEVHVSMRKVGSPTDSVRASIHSDSGGQPGTNLEQVDVVGSGLSTSFATVVFPFTNATVLSTGTTYHLQISRTGNNDPDNYYEIQVDENVGYASGSMQVYDGVLWQTRPTDADLWFRVLGSEVTTVQIQTLVSQEGQFLSGTDIVDASGVSTNQYRDGRLSARTELQDLLDLGTTNGRRLLFTVMQDRTVRVHEEPAEPSRPDYIWHSDKKITNRYGTAIAPGSMEFVGKWMGLRYRYGTPEGLWWSRYNLFFVEAGEYFIRDEAWHVEGRSAPEEFNLASIGVG